MRLRGCPQFQARKWVRNVAFARHAILVGWARRQKRWGGGAKSRAVREVGWGDKKLENQRRKEAMHTQGVFEGKGKEEGVERSKRPLSEEGSEAQKL
jgi:hypothetical protein